MADKKAKTEKKTENEAQSGIDRRLQNLIPFKPGQSGNPKGGPRGPRLKTLLMRKLRELSDPKDKTKGRKQDELVEATIELAMKGNAKALEIVWDRVDGRVPLPIQGLGDDGEPEDMSYDHVLEVHKVFMLAHKLRMKSKKKGDKKK